jgi:ribonuclease HII
MGNDFANFTVEKKADATYKPVSAASIIAKVTR